MPRKFKRLFLIFLIFFTVLLSFVIYATILVSGISTGETRKDISLEEAQQLVLFPICTTGYLPQNANPKVSIIYEIDDMESQEAAWILFRYKDIKSNKLILEISERYSPRETMKSEDVEKATSSAKYLLLEWISMPSPFFIFNSIFSETWLDNELNKIKLKSNEFDDGIFWYSYEITEPEKYRSTMTRWIANHVEYRVMSFLSIEETQKITKSMFKCISQ